MSPQDVDMNDVIELEASLVYLSELESNLSGAVSTNCEDKPGRPNEEHRSGGKFQAS